MKDTVKKQKVNTKDEFEERVRGVVTEFAEQVHRVYVEWFNCFAKAIAVM